MCYENRPGAGGQSGGRGGRSRGMAEAAFGATPPGTHPVQGYLAHKKQRHPRALQYNHAKKPMVVLRGGGLLRMIEAPL